MCILSFGYSGSWANMKLILFLSGLIVVQAGVIKHGNECDGVKISGVYYDNVTLNDNIDRPYVLVIDYSTNNLYFSYNIKEDDDEYRTARLNLNTKEYNIIEGVNNGFSQTINQETHEIYIGGSDGIYKYDYGNNKAAIIGENGSSLWTLYFNKVLYYSLFPNKIIHTLVDGVSKKLPELEDTIVDSFVIDNEDNIFFTNNTGLYSQKKGTKNVVLYGLSSVIRSLTTDIYGNVYAMVQDGIYAVRKSTKSWEKIVDVFDGFGLTFDHDNNIVYSNGNGLFKLKANKDKKC